MRKVVLLALVSLLFAASAQAQTLTASSMKCACDNPRPLPTNNIEGNAVQTECDINALSVKVPHPGSYLICWNLFGNALTPDKTHDGVNGWVRGPSDQPYLVPRILPPEHVGGSYPASTGVGGCDAVTVDQPFTAVVEVAFNSTGGVHMQQWGCRAPKFPAPSTLTITPVPSVQPSSVKRLRPVKSAARTQAME
jgi:hypothetical protein